MAAVQTLNLFSVMSLEKLFIREVLESVFSLQSDLETIFRLRLNSHLVLT